MDILANVVQACNPPIDEAARAACAAGLSRRSPKHGGAIVAHITTSGCLKRPEPTLEGFAQSEPACCAPVPPQATDQRFTLQAIDCLLRVPGHAISGWWPSNRWPFPYWDAPLGSTPRTAQRSRRQRPSRIAGRLRGPRCQSEPAAIKFRVRLDLCDRQVSGPLLQPGRTA
jgi:hypothetical protein